MNHAELIIDMLDCIIIVLSSDQCIVDINAFGLEFFKCEKNDLLRKPIHIILAPEEIGHFNKAIEDQSKFVTTDCIDIEGNSSIVGWQLSFVIKDQILCIGRDETTVQRIKNNLGLALKRTNLTLNKTLEAFSTIIEYSDAYTAKHMLTVADLAREIAFLMDPRCRTKTNVYTAGMLHDIGKIAIPISVLTAQRKLNIHEWGLLKEHPAIGYEIIKEIPFDKEISNIILQHHERNDGSGYPNGLIANEICTGAKILAVADTVDAMANHRPYRGALGVSKALEEIQINSNKLYDPEVVKATIELFQNGYQFKQE